MHDKRLVLFYRRISLRNLLKHLLLVIGLQPTMKFSSLNSEATWNEELILCPILVVYKPITNKRSKIAITGFTRILTNKIGCILEKLLNSKQNAKANFYQFAFTTDGYNSAEDLVLANTQYCD